MSSHWFEALADHMGPAYLRYSFTKGTDQEVGALVDWLDLEPGMRVLDVGCGPGRHSRALAALGIEVHGLDISETFVELARIDAPAGATFEVADARALDTVVADGSFDAVFSLCQGAFGLAGGAGAVDELPARELDEPILAGMRHAVRPGGLVAVSAFNAYFQVRFAEDFDTFDAQRGVNHEVTEIMDATGVAIPADLWTTGFTPRELRLLARVVGLRPLDVFGVTPGDYGRRPPSVERHEHLLLARRPADGTG